MPAPLIGIALQMSALAFFVCLDTLTKWMTAHYPVPQLMFARFFFHLLIVAAVLRVTMGRVPWRSRRPGLQALRSFCLIWANFSFSLALAYVPLADATAVGFASPLFTVALAALWLGEQVGWRRWLGVGIGLAGVAVALRPPFLTGGEPPHWALALPVCMAAVFAVYQILTRKLAAVDDPRTTILHTGLVSSAITALAQPFVWIWPAGFDWLLLAAMGALGGIGHYLLILAYLRAPASLLAPLQYTQLVWATLASVLVFGDVPDGWTLAGAVVIALGGILVVMPARPSGHKPGPTSDRTGGGN